MAPILPERESYRLRDMSSTKGKGLICSRGDESRPLGARREGQQRVGVQASHPLVTLTGRMGYPASTMQHEQARELLDDEALQTVPSRAIRRTSRRSTPAIESRRRRN